MKNCGVYFIASVRNTDTSIECQQHEEAVRDPAGKDFPPMYCEDQYIVPMGLLNWAKIDSTDIRHVRGMAAGFKSIHPKILSLIAFTTSVFEIHAIVDEWL